MTKRLKLKKSSTGAVSKNIPVEDVNGNKHILKATVISVDHGSVRKSAGRSDEITDEALESLGLSEKIVRPPLSQSELAILKENSSELGQIIDAMKIGVVGFGGRLKERKIPDSIQKTMKLQIEEEKAHMQTFFQFPNPEGSWTKLVKSTWEDYESTGNAYWELVPTITRNGRYSSFNKLDVSTMRICKLDRTFTKFVLNYVDSNFQMKARVFIKKFRRFVQVVGTKKIYFKEFGDPRCVDKRSGEIADPTKLPKKYWANEVYHWKLYTSRRTPYGLPRYTGNIIAIRGSRSADETNILTQQNNHVPSMAILVSGGQLTEGSVNRIKDFVDTQIKSSSNYSKFLLIEGQSSHDGLSGPGNVKLEIQPLTNAQHSDQLWQDYDKNNSDKIRRSFRIPPILLGKGDDYTKATAVVSEKLAEKYVFNPEREEFDLEVNKIMLQQGFRFHFWKTNSPNVTDDENLVRILTGAERTGGLTPRISRFLLEDILNRDLPDFDENSDFDPDLPFSYSLAKLMHNAGEANQNGTFAPQGQTPKAPGTPGQPGQVGQPAGATKSMMTFDPVGWINQLIENASGADSEVLEQIRQSIEDSLDTEAFGEPDRKFFDHAH